jgi:signal transduction histidine kinase
VKTPAFIAEAIAPANRNKLRFGIYSGYAMAAMFAVLATAASAFELTPFKWAFIGLISTKLLTNSIAWLGLVRDRFVATTQVLNSTADVILLTGAIYFTGGAYSPLLATYVIIVAAVALLSNVGATLALCAGVVISFTGMMVGMATGLLPATNAPGQPGHAPSVGYTIVAITYCLFVVGVPAYFCVATLRTLREKERDLEARSAQLIQANTARSQFVASMTHELRTPIHGVQGLADVIAAGVYGPVTDKQKEAVATIKRSAQSLLALVDDVLNLARADANRIEARPTPIDIGALVGRVVASVSWMIGTKKITLESDVAPELPFVQSDDRWLAHVLVNLVSNAVKFTPEGGTITLRAAPRGDELMIAVIDTGPGIAADHLPHVFERYWQARPASQAGAGLGLYIARGIVEAHGGRIWAESSAGGARLIFTLPLTRPAATDSSPSSGGRSEVVERRQTAT